MRNRILIFFVLLMLLGSSFLVGAAFSPAGGQKSVNGTPPISLSANQQTDNGKPLPIADIVEKVRPAVVLITVQSKPNGDFSWHPMILDSGTGLIYDNSGYIITNDHVVANRASAEITVTLLDKRKFTAQVVERDQAKDLAVIKIDADNLPIASFGNSDDLRVGDWVVAIGNALDLDGGPTVTMGIISALDRAINSEGQGKLYHLIQTDASINPGNSGGPLIGLDGRVVGLNAAVAQDAQGIGFAIPANDVSSMAANARTKNGGSIRQ